MNINVNINTIFNNYKKSAKSDVNDLLKMAENVNQTKPIKNYVYAHLNSKDVFYIGKGVRNRAWSKDRQYWWKWYVDTKLKDSYKVIIIKDNLTSIEAEDFEWQLIERYSQKLLNHVKPDMEFDNKASDKLVSTLNNIKKSEVKAKKLESTDLNESVVIYKKCLDDLNKIKNINPDGSFLGVIKEEESLANGFSGRLFLIDRLTICLKKLGKLAEAKEVSIQYFYNFKKDQSKSVAKKIAKRVKLNLNSG